MYVLAAGPGNYTENSLSRLNTKNPMRRDVQMVAANGHLVVQLDASKSPGIWPFHCHVAWHSSAGFFSQMLFKPDELATHRYDIPHDVSQTCRDWAKFTSGVVPDQIDSGLKARAEIVKQERSATLLR